MDELHIEEPSSGGGSSFVGSWTELSTGSLSFPPSTSTPIDWTGVTPFFYGGADIDIDGSGNIEFLTSGLYMVVVEFDVVEPSPYILNIATNSGSVLGDFGSFRQEKTSAATSRFNYQFTLTGPVTALDTLELIISHDLVGTMTNAGSIVLISRLSDLTVS